MNRRSVDACVSVLLAVTAAAASTSPRPAADRGAVQPAAADPAAVPLDALRTALANATNATERDRAGRDLLDALDRAGLGRAPEAQRLVRDLVGDAPADEVEPVRSAPFQAALLWRRAEFLRRAEDRDGAIATLEKLIAARPADPLAFRARRALPGLLLETGRREQSARADEQLLADHLADPGAVLGRLARTYALLGDDARVHDVVSRLAAVSPDALKYDPDVAWLAADSADRAGTRKEAAAALLRFANVFPGDPRRADALVRAGRAFAGEGRRETALGLMNESLAAARSPEVEIAGRVGHAEMLAASGRPREARAEYERVFHDAADAATACPALAKAVDLAAALDGADAALATIAQRVSERQRFAAECGRAPFARLIGGLSDELAAHPEHAAFAVELARRAQLDDTLPAETRLAAAGLREQVGAYEKAASIYQSLASQPGTVGARARAGLARCRPHDVPTGAAASDPERLAGLEREQAWALILKAITTHDAKPDPDARALAARSAFMAHDAAAAKTLLDPLRTPGPAAALLRADARALAGDGAGACGDYRAALASARALSAVESAWLEVRVAGCDLRDGRREPAVTRLRALLDAKPPEPAGVAAQLLLAQASARGAK